MICFTDDGFRFAMDANETLIPTSTIRWFVDFDGEKLLQSAFWRGSKRIWITVPETRASGQPGRNVEGD